VEVYLSGTPTPEEEAYLEQEIGAIALRDPNMTAYNVMAGKREQQRTSVQVVLMFAGLLMVFFALSLGLINNHLTGRLRAERRAIGSLRALGADRSVLYNSYARQLVRMVLFGAIPGIAVSAALVIQQGMNRYNSFPPRYYLLLAGLECALILLMFGFSALHLRRLVGAVLRQSVISQIREAG
jgi:ABC-type antimicrobial peptide transport system permease subunit